MNLLRASPNLTQWATPGDVAGKASILAFLCDALCDRATELKGFTLTDYRCHALCLLEAEFAGVRARLAKQGLLDTSFHGDCYVYSERVPTDRTTPLHAALDTEAGSLEVVALLLRAGANPTLVVQGIAESRSPLARAVHDLRNALDEFVVASPVSVDQRASSVKARFAVASLLVSTVARDGGAQAVAAAAPGDRLALALLPRCASHHPFSALQEVLSVPLRVNKTSRQPLALFPGGDGWRAGTSRSFCRCCAPGTASNASTARSRSSLPIAPSAPIRATPPPQRSNLCATATRIGWGGRSRRGAH